MKIINFFTLTLLSSTIIGLSAMPEKVILPSEECINNAKNKLETGEITSSQFEAERNACLTEMIR